MKPDEAREVIRLYSPVAPANRSAGMNSLLLQARRVLRAAGQYSVCLECRSGRPCEGCGALR
ncbi:MAG TPA: hypothetical protein VMW48_05225 [Vicinamibacterales bacterium]|nr:hypothetical protein [Vicinamibacterales bacterium]